MDIKRLLLALVLSFIFMITYTALFVDDTETATPNNSTQPTLDNAQDGSNSLNNTVENKNNMMLSDVEQKAVQQQSMEANFNELIQTGDNANKPITTDLMQLVLTNGGTSIKEVQVVEKDGSGNYKYQGVWDRSACDVDDTGCVATYIENKPVQILDNDCNPCLYSGVNDMRIWFHIDTIREKNGDIVIESLDSHDYGITKTTTISNNSYSINHKFNGLDPNMNTFLVWSGGIEPSERTISYGVGGGISVYGADEDGDSYTTLATLSDPESLPKTGWTDTEWVAIWSKYFQKAITYQSLDGVKATSLLHHSEEISKDNPKYIYTTITSRHTGVTSIDVDSYIGPIDPGHFEKAPHLDHLFYGKWYAMGPLKRLIIWLLTSLGDLGLNYGVICILFAFLIRFFTGPLTKKSFLANQRMQALQPKIKKIQEKNKDNKQKASQETMALYKAEGVNPLGGCLPILIQMPLLIALFQAFQNTIEFRGASLWPLSFWIPDLSQPDVFISTDFFTIIPFIGEWFFGHGISLLPILMGVTLFLNMKMSAPASSEGSPKFPMYFMNIFFVLLFNTFPAGLNLYYTAYNILNFIQQKKLKQAS